MKILILNLYQNLNSRGGERFVSDLCEHLPSSMNTKILFSPNAIRYQTNPKSVPSRLFVTKKRLWELWFTMQNLKNIIRYKPDIVIPLNGAWQALICRIYCSLSGSRLIIVGQSGPGWDDRWNLLMKPDVFVALTKTQLAWAKKSSVWIQKHAVIPNGVDTSKFNPKGKKLSFKLQKPIILCVAASSESKRVRETVLAVSKTKASLLLVGVGELDHEIDTLGHANLGSRFLHKNFSPGEMPSVYRSCDLFTLYSRSSEAFGIVYLEAMATGLGCVATDDPLRREIIADAGLYVKDSSDYSSKLQKALKIDWTKKAISQASEFTVQKMADSYVKIFIETCVEK